MMRITTACLVTLAISLAAIPSWATARRHLTDAQMSDIHGGDGSSVRDNNYYCDEAECDNLNTFVTPPTLPYVSVDLCEGLDGFPCIDCGTNAKSKKLYNNHVNPGYTQVNPPTGTYCQAEGGRKGECLNGFCINWIDYECGIVIPNYISQEVITP